MAKGLKPDGTNKSPTMTDAEIDALEYRRKCVARLRVRGLTLHEIAASLARPEEEGGFGITNAEGRPISIATVSKDLTLCKKRWRQDSTADIQELKAKALAEIEEVKRQAWLTREYDVILRAIAQTRGLLGLDEATLVGVISPQSQGLEEKLAQLAQRMDALKKSEEEGDTT